MVLLLHSCVLLHVLCFFLSVFSFGSNCNCSCFSVYYLRGVTINEWMNSTKILGAEMLLRCMCRLEYGSKAFPRKPDECTVGIISCACVSGLTYLLSGEWTYGPKILKKEYLCYGPDDGLAI